MLPPGVSAPVVLRVYKFGCGFAALGKVKIMALGNILKEAREARGLSTTDVAEHTNMMVQIVEELENEDFHRIAAPIYGRGFLKLYAELIDIEVQPLIDEFMDIYTGKTAPSVTRMECAPAEVKKPVPIAAPAEEQEISVAPQRVEIVPQQAVNIDAAPKPLPKQEKQPSVPVESQPSAQTSASEPLVSSAPAAEAIPVQPEPETKQPQNDLCAADSELPELSSEIPPEPGDELFGADEPNLFNTSPLQERIAEARRLMDETEDARKDEKKKASLHLGTNQRLPVFQIGGRMDKTYDAKPRKNRSGPSGHFPRAMLSSIGGFFSNLKIDFPLKLKSRNRNVFVFGALGVFVLVFMVLGVVLIFKLTKPASKDDNLNGPTVTEVLEKPSRPVSKTKRQIPPPPDMYFD